MSDDDSTLEYVAERVEQEGFWYCFDSYSDFNQVKDAEFHRLREEFLVAGNALKAYIEKGRA